MEKGRSVETEETTAETIAPRRAVASKELPVDPQMSAGCARNDTVHSTYMYI